MSSSGSFARRPLAAFAVALSAVAVLAATASAVVRPRTGPSADRSSQRYFDVRDATRTAVARSGAQSAQRAGARSLSARTSLRNRFGRQAHLQLDAVTGTPRSFQRLDGVLAGPASGSARSVAMRYARANAAALGLGDADFGTLASAPTVRTSRTGITTVRWRQYFDGVPTYDNGLRVNLGLGNRIVSVQGAPVHDLRVSSVVPLLGAEQAMSALQRSVGITRSASVTSRSSGARRTTTFSTGDKAQLVLFQLASGTRLAWSLTYRARSDAWYEAVVDATTGHVLHRANLTKFAVNVSVFNSYPGSPGAGGTQVTFNMTPYLDDGQSQILSGPFARTYLDVNDDNRPNAGEEVAPAVHTFSDFTGTVGAAGFCQATAKCSWNPSTLTRNSWQTNKEHEAIQSHYYVSKYHDHLLSAPIGFNADDGNFEDQDRVEVNANDGAATGAGGGPNNGHIDNANMSTPPDGAAPLMQMYLFQPVSGAPFRAINGDDDAGVVYHEYTHGLSNRLVVDDQGFGALNSPQSGAMGEAWSDWYAKDFLVAQGQQTDTPAAGDVFMGVYTDGVQPGPGAPGLIRTEGLDCKPNSDPAACPGGVDANTDGQPDTGPGGYTYGDFGVVGGGAEVHSDGEIWAQTLWDLREAAGSPLAEELVTDGMRLSPTEPTFLDMRNAILAADQAVNGGTHRNLIWTVFAARGMGFFAAAVNGSDTQPAEDFAMPPAPNGPKGTITGNVTDASSGLPVEGQRVGIAGHTSDPAFGDHFATETDANGNYTIPNVPAGTYPKLAFLPAAGFDLVVNPNVVVPAGGTTVQNAVSRRDWSALSGGATVSTNDDTGSIFGCGIEPLLDQTLGAGWSAFQKNSPDPGNNHLGTPPSATIELPQTIDVTAFGMDPGFTCGDDETATTREYRVETSTDGLTFRTAVDGTRADRQFGVGDAGRLNMVAPDAAGTDVRFVRLTLISPVRENTGDSGEDFIDFSELEVFGGPKNVLPSGILSANPGGTGVNQPVTLTAKFSDPDSRISGYDWDLDGNGSIDRSTVAPVTSASYGTPGTFAPKVFAKDFRGGSGSASTGVLITSTPGPPKPSNPPSPSLPKTGRHGGARFRIACDSACLGTATLTISKATAKKLKLKSRTVATKQFLFSRARTSSVTITVSKSVLRKMRKAKIKTLTVRLRVSATDLENQKRTASRTVRIRRN